MSFKSFPFISIFHLVSFYKSLHIVSSCLLVFLMFMFRGQSRAQCSRAKILYQKNGRAGPQSLPQRLKNRSSYQNIAPSSPFGSSGLGPSVSVRQHRHRQRGHLNRVGTFTFTENNLKPTRQGAVGPTRLPAPTRLLPLNVMCVFYV